MTDDASMTVLLTGPTGFVGRVVCQQLAAAGLRVRAFTRQGVDIPGASEVRPVGDLTVPVDWSAHLTGINTVVHLAARVHVMRENAADPLAAFRAMNVDATVRLAEASAAAGVRRFVFLSSIKVNGERTTSRPFTPADLPAPLDAYGQSKLEAEEGLRRLADRGAFDLVILRSPLVYGPGVRGNVRRLLRLVDSGLPLPFGSVRNRRSLIGLDNLVKAIVHSARPDARPGTYLVSDGAPVSTPELLRAIARGLGRPSRLLPVPAGFLRLAGFLIGQDAEMGRLLDSLEIDNSAARSGLGWAPSLSFESGINQLTAWYRTERSAARG